MKLADALLAISLMMLFIAVLYLTGDALLDAACETRGPC